MQGYALITIVAAGRQIRIYLVVAEVQPNVSVTVSVTVYVPPAVNVCVVVGMVTVVVLPSPNAHAYRVIGENVWKVLESMNV